jgi:LacI family transcriptional regulator
MANVSIVSMKEIARMLDVSIATVSRAIRNHGDISSRTRDRVLKTAQKLGYRPNLLIRGIQTGRTHNIGVMVPPHNSFWSDVLVGIHNRLAADDYAPIMLWYDKEDVLRGSEGERFVLKQIHALIDRRVDGVIMWPTVTETYSEHLDELESRNVPVVTIDHELPFADSVVTDEEQAARLITKHLYDLGHRHIVHLASDQRWVWAKRRLAFLEKTTMQYHDVRLSVVELADDEQIPEAAKKILQMSPRPTAVYACYDEAALVMCKTAFQAGLRVPQDLSVVGFSDAGPFNEIAQPPLTTIRQNGNLIGSTAADVLLQRLEDRIDEEKPRRVVLPCELIIRGSTAPVTLTT